MKRVRVVTFIVIFILIAVVVLLFIRNLHLENELDQVNLQVQKQTEELKKREDEITFMINDSAQVSRPFHSEKYNFQTFGICSPLFEGKEVSIEEYLYKRSKIIKKTLSFEVPEISDGVVKVTTWQFPDAVTDSVGYKYYLPNYASSYEAGSYDSVVELNDIRQETVKGYDNDNLVGVNNIFTTIGNKEYVTRLQIDPYQTPLRFPVYIQLYAEHTFPYVGGRFGSQDAINDYNNFYIVAVPALKAIANTLSNQACIPR